MLIKSEYQICKYYARNNTNFVKLFEDCNKVSIPRAFICSTTKKAMLNDEGSTNCLFLFVLKFVHFETVNMFASFLKF